MRQELSRNLPIGVFPGIDVEIPGMAAAKERLGPLVAYFVRAEWLPAFWIFPTYWPAKLLWTLQTEGVDAWWYLAVGLAYQSLLLFILLRRFNHLVE